MHDLTLRSHTKHSYEELVGACGELGLRAGDTIFAHSDVISLYGLPEMEESELMTGVVEALQRVVGPSGTIIMPTFTFSFLSERWSGPPAPFDVDQSVSRTGSLTEFFRKMPGVARTHHPTHSVAVWGQEKAFYLDVGTSTFDRDSIFGKVHDRNAWLVSLGADIKYFTFIHFVEKQFGVAYRDDESLTGTVVHDGISEDVTISFYKQRRNIVQQHQFFRDYLRQTGLVNVVRHGNGEVSAIRSRTYFDEATRKLESDTYYFSRKKSLKRLVRDRVRRLVGP